MAKKNPPTGGNKKEKEENLAADRLKDIQIVDELQESYIDYAMSVIVSRAIPDIRDGLKPVQRRILWAMWDMGLKSTSKFIKSARVVGEVLGKYHPHGDSAVYDAMVRMAQDFSLRYPLVNGQGNFGCFTGDTKIKLADGRSLSFRELIKEDRKGKKNYAFTFNHEIGEIEIAEVKKPRKTGNSAELVKIALDNGRELKCTPDHKFMLRNGKYGEAQDLKPGDSLMPGYTRSSDKNDNPETVGYLMIQEPRSGEWNFIHHLADKWNLKNGKYEKSAGRVRHHRDFNKENNNPDNVIRMGWKEHWKLHSELAAWRYENDPEYVRKLAEGRRKYIDNNREIFSERARKLNKKLWKSEKFREKIISQVKKMWQDPEYKKRMSRLSSKQLKEKWQEEEFQKLMSKIKSAEMKKRWQDPEYRKEQTKRMKEMSDELWSNEKHREYISKIMKERTRDPKWRAKQSKISKKLWQKPEYRSKYPEDHFSKMAKKLWMDESVRTFHSERAKEQWKNPGFRRKAISAARKGNKKYLKEHPNHMKEMARIAARSLKSNWQNSAYKKQVVGNKILRHVHNLLEEHGNVTPSLYERFRIQNGTPALRNALGYFNNFEEIVEKAKTYNHTVKSVEFVKEKRDVYDITIDNTHNFLLDAGIFVHNSIDSDPPAAQRYTEAKLSKISEELLVDIEKDTVDWESNYDGTRQEPKYLPAKLPELLLNGTMGIAVGMATSIPPHNLEEVIDAIVHLVASPDATVKDLMKYLPGPDFPTGGLIYDAEELREAYSTGRGSVTIQAATDVEERQKHMTLVINEIPFQVNKSSLIEKIASLVQEKKIEGIKDVRDESGREGIRMAVDLKQGVAPERVLNQLFKNTELQKKFYFNMVALVDGLQPRTVSLKDILSAYVEHRKVTITRKIKYDLKKAEERAHVLEGLVIALDDINKVIATIKKSKDRDDAHKNLVSKFKLTPVQADAILDMKLQSLASLEARKIKDELKEKKKLIKELKAILKSKKKILDIIVDELEVMKKEYGDDRRTKIVKKELKEFKDEDFIAEKETVIFLTNDGYIKRIPPTSFKTQGRGGRGLHGFDLKEKDKVSELVIASTHDDILFFTDSGKVFKTKVYKIPASSRTAKGKLIHTFLGLSDNEKVATFLTYNEKDKDMRSKFLCFGTERGIVKKTAVPEFDNVQSTGIIAINLKSDDALRWVKTSTGSDHFVFATREGRLIRFSEKEVRPMGRGASGVGAIRVGKEDGVTGFVIIRGNESEKDKKFLVITENGYGKQTPIGKYKTQKRGGRGITTVKVTKKTGPLSAIRLVDKEIEEVIAFSAKGLIIKTKLKDIRTAGRATQGVRIMRLDKDDAVVGVVCL